MMDGGNRFSFPTYDPYERVCCVATGRDRRVHLEADRFWMEAEMAVVFVLYEGDTCLYNWVVLRCLLKDKGLGAGGPWRMRMV